MTQKYLIIPLFLVLVFSGIKTAFSNPFSCKPQGGLQVESIHPATNSDVAYKGYLIMKQRQFAIIQIGNRQHAVQAMESIDGIKILEILPDSLTYSRNQRTIKLELEGDRR